MKNLVFVLIGWLLCSCGASAQQDANADQFLALTGKANVQVLDVRTADEYKTAISKMPYRQTGSTSRSSRTGPSTWTSQTPFLFIVPQVAEAPRPLRGLRKRDTPW